MWFVLMEGWMDGWSCPYVFLKNPILVGEREGACLWRLVSYNLIWMDANTLTSLSSDTAFIFVWLFVDEIVCW